MMMMMNKNYCKHFPSNSNSIQLYNHHMLMVDVDIHVIIREYSKTKYIKNEVRIVKK